MSRQTAMQEMHEWLADKWSDPGKLLSCNDVCMKIEELLPIEKRQIIDAWVNGNDNEPKETTEHQKRVITTQSQVVKVL